MGKKVYVATTVAGGCILGAELSPTAGTPDLQSAYGVFADEVAQLHQEYQPQTVNTDGWEATQAAWRTLFPGITLILCFLHSILAIGQRCRSQKELSQVLSDKLWDIYRTSDAPGFIERLRHLQAWAICQPLPESILTKLLSLPSKRPNLRLPMTSQMPTVPAICSTD